jgi:hypothetical protein
MAPAAMAAAMMRTMVRVDMVNFPLLGDLTDWSMTVVKGRRSYR